MRPGQVAPVEARARVRLREEERGLREVGHPGLVAATAPEDEEEAEQEEEEEEEGGGGEEGGEEPGGERPTLGQLGEAGDVGAPEREREVTDRPPVLEVGQERDKPGQVTPAVQRVPSNLQPRQPRPGETVRPQDSQLVVAQIHPAQFPRGGERGREMAQSGVVADGERLQSSEPPQTGLLYVQQEGAVRYLQGGQGGGQLQEMFPSQVLQIPLTKADLSEVGERTEIKGRGEEVVRNIQELQEERRDRRPLVTAARPAQSGEARITDLERGQICFYFSQLLVLNYCLPLDLKVPGVLSVYKDSVLTKDYYSN